MTAQDWRDWRETFDEEMGELYAALGMKYQPRRKSAASAERKDECAVLRPSFCKPMNGEGQQPRSEACVVLRPAWLQKEGKGARQEKQLNGFALETKVALVSKEGFQAASKTAVQKGKVNGHPLKTKATVQRPQPMLQASSLAAEGHARCVSRLSCVFGPKQKPR